MNLLDRLIPLPKEIEISSIARVRADEVSIYICGGESVTSEPAVRTAAKMLKRIAFSTTKSSFPIKLALAEDCESAIAPTKIVSRLCTLPNFEQAYVIYPSSDSHGINIVANSANGLLYAVRTFMQLLDLDENISADTRLMIPMPLILDWPDIGERGQWGGSSESDLKWTSQWKLNHLEAHPVFTNDDDGYPEATFNRELYDEAVSRGVKIVPFIAHLESISLSLKELPEGTKSTPDPSQPLPSDYYPGICSSSPASVEMISRWLESVAESAPFSDICVWLSEQSSPCFCEDCIGKEQFELETKLICKAFDLIRPKYPDLKLRLLLTQGSYPYNDKVIAAKSPDVGITYYDGGRTYDSSHQPMIYPLLEEYSRAGGWLGCYPQITHCWRAIFPWTAPQFLQYRAQEFVDKKLDSITGYAVISNRQHEFNVAAMAEFAWNSTGRTPEDFARAWATVNGYTNPATYAKWAVMAGEAGWMLAESNLMLALIYNPSLVLNSEIREDHRFEKAQIGQPDRLQEAITLAQQALDLSKTLNLPNAVRESECCLAGLRAFMLLHEIFDLLALDSLQAEQKDRLASLLDELDEVAQILGRNQQAWAKDIEEKAKSNTLHSRVYDTGLVLFRTCEAVRLAAQRFDIVDPRPEMRLHRLGAWNHEAFKDSATPVLEWDISGVVDQVGGNYAVGVDFVDSCYHTDLLAIQAVDKSGNVVADAENVPGDVSIWEKWKDFPIDLPKHDGGLMLRVKISGLPEDAPEDRRTCEGVLGIRRNLLSELP